MLAQETREACEESGGWWEFHFKACIHLDEGSGGSGGGESSGGGADPGDDGGGNGDLGGGGISGGLPVDPCLVSDDDEDTNCVGSPPDSGGTEVTPIYNPAEFPYMPYYDEDESPPPPTTVITRGPGEIRTAASRKSARNPRKAKVRGRGRVRR
jgi:hypothetical protein